jgi:hypothetical protein
MKTQLLVITSLLNAWTAAGATEPAFGQNVDASAAFVRLKALAGEWKAQTKEGEAHLSYEVISGGHSVVERDSEGNRPPMLTVYYLDGNRLLLTHYCMAANQPRMQARQFDAGTGELKFEFLDASNLANPGTGHMHNATIRFVDENHVTTEWQYFENGKPKFAEAAQYSHVK